MSNVKPMDVEDNNDLYRFITYWLWTIHYHIVSYRILWQESIMAKLLLQLQTADVRMQCQMALVSEPACPTSEVLSSVYPGSNLSWVASFWLGILQPLIAISFPLPLVHLEFFSNMWAKKRFDYDWPWLPDDTGLKTASELCQMDASLHEVSGRSFLASVSEWVARVIPTVKGWRYIICILCIYDIYIHV